MQLNLHDKVRALGKLALCACCLLPMAVLAATLSGGPMLGHITTRTASLWLQADTEAEARIEYWPELGASGRSLSTPVHLDKAADYSAVIELTGLHPDTRYRYAVFLDGAQVLEGEGLKLRTLPAWQGRGEPADFTVYMGSCAFLNDPQWDRAEKPFGGGEEIFARIAASAGINPQPSLMLWLGDNVYFRDTDLVSPWGMNARYRANRSNLAVQSLLRATANYAVWDDHDYGPENANRSFVFKQDSSRLFQRYWANPSYGLAEMPGIFTTFSFGDADFFLLDDRTYRAADTTVEPDNEVSWWQEFKDWAIGSNQLTRLLGRRFAGSSPAWLGESKTLFGPAQLDWLKQALINSRAIFKIVVSGSQLFNDVGNGEGWQNFPNERESFLEWLDRQKIDGLLFLSGDRRHSELIKHERKDGYPLYELTCSPLTATPALPEAEKDNPQRVAGTLVRQRNYCTLEVAGRPQARRLILRSYSSAGAMLWEKTLDASSLQAAQPASP